MFPSLLNEYAKVQDQGRRLLPPSEKNHNFLNFYTIFTNVVLFEAQQNAETENVSIFGQKNFWMCFFGI